MLISGTVCMYFIIDQVQQPFPQYLKYMHVCAIVDRMLTLLQQLLLYKVCL